jgi:hypothetical protein
MSNFSNGNVFVFKMDATAGGALTDYSAYIRRVRLRTARENNKLARGGGNAKASLPGALEHDGEIEFWGHPTMVNALRAAMDQSGTPVTTSIEWQEQGTASGNLKRTAEVFWSELEEETDAEEPYRGSAQFDIDGALTTTAQS